MDLTEDSEMGEKEGTPEPRPGKGGTSSSSAGMNGTECYDPDLCGCTSSIDQLVIALCEAFMEGSPSAQVRRNGRQDPLAE